MEPKHSEAFASRAVPEPNNDKRMDFEGAGKTIGEGKKEIKNFNFSGDKRTSLDSAETLDFYPIVSWWVLQKDIPLSSSASHWCKSHFNADLE